MYDRNTSYLIGMYLDSEDTLTVLQIWLMCHMKNMVCSTCILEKKLSEGITAYIF